MSVQNIGKLEQYTAVRAAPDTFGRGIVAGLVGMVGRGLTGRSGGVVGDDRGSAVHTFQGPVTLPPSPIPALRSGAIAMNGVYRPIETFQESLSSNPNLDPYARLLWNRLSA